MKTKGKFSNKDLTTIKKELLINGGDLDLYLDLFLTDENGNKEKVLTKKADSILANFMRILYLQMARDNRDNVMGGTFYHNELTTTNITSITSGTGGVIRLNFGSIYFSSIGNGKITLGGFQGVDIDGQYDYTKVDSDSIELTGTVYQAGWVTGTGGVAVYLPITNINNNSYKSFKNSGIIIGTGNQAVTIDDQMLHKQIPNGSVDGSLTYNASTVSQDTNDATSAQITLTRTFTNNAALTVTVREIGYLMQAGTNSRVLLTMRDVLPSDVNVSQGKTLTANYRIKTNLDSGTDPGGFVASFMRMLYRHISGNSRAVFDINNVSRTYVPAQVNFAAVKCGGYNKEYTPYENEEGWKNGIVVGSDNTPVSMADYFLNSVIPHGKAAGEMLYYGGFAQDFAIGADYAQFDIYKAFENASGLPIDVNEYALVVGSGLYSLDSTGYLMEYFNMVARNTLSVGVTVEANKMLKIIYTIKCIVTGGASS